MQLNVRCNKGFDHGKGVTAWMYPPVHRLLGWTSRPSKLSLVRNVWRLDQLKSISYENIFVNGLPAESDEATINRFPTLLDAALLSKEGEKLANIADLIFDTKTGNILFYLIARTNPKLPGTSRWRFDLDRIVDQEPGCVTSNINSLDELPLLKSSIRQDFLKKSRKIKDNLLEFSTLANQKLEGWLDENEINNINDETVKSFKNKNKTNIKYLDDNDQDLYSRDYNIIDDYIENEEDPWI